MGTLYLIDSNNPTLLSSKINDTVNLQPGDTRSIRGSFVVNLPYDVPMDGTPDDLQDLITKKYQGILSVYPGFTNIIYDEQIDAADWDTTTCVGTTLGSRQTNSLNLDSSSTMTTTAHALASVPEVCMVRFELFHIVQTDPATGQVTRAFQDVTASESTVEVKVAFDGATFIPVTSGVLLNIPLGSRGNQLKVRFSRTFAGSQRTYLGSWAVAY